VDGTELLTSLKERHPDMDVIMVTGYASVENAVLALNKGAAAYITKPMNMDELLAIVRKLLEKQILVREKRQVEEQIKASLKEKEVLLKEIHHRVKNNMQIVYSLLSLQSERIRDEDVLGMIRDTQQRVKSMTFIHERLYQSRDLARIEFGDYVKKLVLSLFNSYGVDYDRLKYKIEIENVFLDINAAIPCGLIINELVSNSLKHAFPKRKEKAGENNDKAKGEIYIGLISEKNNKYTLIVSDNGVGFPDDLNFRNTDSLGLQIVITLVEQLEGRIELLREGGATFRIEFSPE
jgi:two-component sensor histidine kinase